MRRLSVLWLLLTLQLVAVGVGASSPPLWRLDISRDEPTQTVSGPNSVHDNERVFYVQNGYVKAAEAETGKPLWALRVGHGARLRYSSKQLLAAGARTIHLLEPATGRVRWSRAVREPAAYTLAQRTLYVVTLGKLRAFDSRTGRVKWRTNGPLLVPSAPLTVRRNRVFAHRFVMTTLSNQINLYNARTGKLLGQLPTLPKAIVNRRIFAQDNWFLIDRPNDVYLSLYSLRTGKRLENRTFSIRKNSREQHRVRRLAVSEQAVYLAGGGNLACFPLGKRGGEAKPTFVRVPRGEVVWRAGPKRRVFVLEWRGGVWLVREKLRHPCAPLDLRRDGQSLGPGRVARVTFSGRGTYVSLRNGLFYAVDRRSNRVVRTLRLPAPAYGPTRVVGSVFVVQAGGELLAFRLP